MRIALVSKTNGCVGGASYFAENLGRWLIEAGHETIHFCVEPRRPLQSYQRHLECTGLASRVVRHLNWRARRMGLVEPFPWEYWFGLRRDLGGFDIIHFHDLFMAISPRSLVYAAKHCPVVLTAHDTSVFTGGCINPMNCRRFEEQCGRCPQARTLGRFDFTRHNWRLVQKTARAKVSYIFPSRWIQNEACRSLPIQSEAEHIPNGFDAREYRFPARAEARVALKIPADRKVVVFASASLDNKLKGLVHALRALSHVKALNPLAMVVGATTPAVREQLAGISSLFAGFVEERERIGTLFAAADVLLYPSLGDNLPITIQEAMSAGTPVLAFDVGGVREMVRHGETGWLVPAGNQEALNQKLREILLGEDTARVGEQARAMIRNEFAAAECVGRHSKLYQRLLQSRPTGERQ